MNIAVFSQCPACGEVFWGYWIDREHGEFELFVHLLDLHAIDPRRDYLGVTTVDGLEAEKLIENYQHAWREAS